ncbi:Ribokinase-like protein [Apiospora hydei]|uniref:Ribokinase-like protein n=1 Tax=Apiospora hydei TaxID=1337664 RepID=A0ABR1V720_9PEZI
MLNLVCVGACYLDTILSVPRFPEEDSKLRATSLSVRRGGNCPNSLEVLQQLLKAQEQQSHKVRPYLISCLPSEEGPASARVKDSFGPDSPVDFTRCIYREQHDQPASSYIIRSEATGTRTLVNYNDLPEMSVHEFQAAIEGLGRQDDMWVHFEGRIPETTLRCIQYLRQALPKASISVEVEKPDREGLQELAAEADVVFYSKSWAESNGYKSAHECLMAQSEVARRASLLLCTWGAEGAASLSLPSKRSVSCPALRPGQTVRVVDTVGAGDTFIAGMLYGLLCHQDDWDADTKVRFAVQLATSKVQVEGFGGVGTHVMGDGGDGPDQKATPVS